MSTRRRAGTWQDEVARSFSRLFSRSSSQEKEEESGKDPAEEQERGDRSLSRLFFRSPSQEKKDGSDRTEHGEEQERSHSPSRLFFRKISLESKGGNDNASPAKGNKEEQDRSRVFTRLFTRTSSQEKEEENDSSRMTREDQSRLDDNHGGLIIDKHEELPSTESEQVTLAQTSSSPLHNISEPEEENDGEFPHNSKVLDSEKQSRENFFHFIGNLFHFSPKSSLGNPKQDAGVQESCKELVDAQDKNNLDKEDLNQEGALDDHSGTEEASQQNTARHEQENPGVSEGEDPKDVLERCEDATTDTPKLNGHTQDAPAITYGTYRGSRRIRKLLKRRADVNSPIPEKEETPETSSVGDTNTEHCLMLHECVKMEPVADRNGEGEMPPSKIHIKRQSELEPLDQNGKLHNDDNIIRNAKNLKLANDLEAKDTPICTNSVEVANSSEVVEGQQPNIEEFLIAVSQLNAKGSSEIMLQPNTGVQPTLGGSLNISGHLEQNVDNAEGHTVESTISRNSESNNEGHYTDDEPKTVDISDTVRHKQPNTDDVSKQPEDHQPDTESVHFPEILQKSIDDDSKTETGSSPKVAENFNLLPHRKETIKDCLIDDIQANTNSSKKYQTFSVMDNLCSSEFSTEDEDTLVKTEELEDTKVPVGLENRVADMQSALKQSHLEIGDSGEWSKSQQVVEGNLHVKEKPHEDLSDNLHLTTHNVSGRSSDKNYEDFNSPDSYLKSEIERPDIIDLQPNVQLISSSTKYVEPSTTGNSVIKEQMQLHGDEYLKQPIPDLNITFLNKTVSESELMPNSHIQLNGMSITSEDLQQIESVRDLPANADIIPENDLQNDEELLNTEQQPNTSIFFQLKEETPESSSVGDTNTEHCLMLHEWVKMEPVADRHGENEMPPSKIHIKRQSELEPLDQKAKLHTDDNIIRNAKNLKLTNDLEAQNTPICTNSVEVANSSEIVEGQQPNIEEFLIAVPQLNAKGSSEIIFQPNTGVQPTLGGSLNISGHLEQNVDNAEGHTVESTISRNSESNNEGHYTDDEPKTVDISDIVRHKQPNTDDVSKQPENHQPDTESVHFPEIRQKSIDDDSKTETGSSPKVAENFNLLPHRKETIKDCLIDDIQANTNSSKKYQTFSVMDNLCSSEFSTEDEDTLVKTEELEDTKVPVGLENRVADMQSALKQSHLEIEDSGEWSKSQQVVEGNLHVKEKPHKDLSDNWHLTTHNVSGRSSDKNYEDFNSPESFLKSEIERPDIIDLQPNAQLISSSAKYVEPSTTGNSVIKEQMQLHGDEYLKQPIPDLNITFLNKTVSKSELMPNSHIQLNGMSITSEDLQQSMGDLPANADIITENDLQNDEELLKTEQQPNTSKFFKLKELNDTILEKTLSGSENLDLQLNKTRSSKLLDQTGNMQNLQTNANIMPENGPQKDEELLQANTKVNSQLKESSDESLLKSRIISKMIENQKPNIHIESNVSDSMQAEVEEPSKVNLCQEPNSKIHVPEVNNGYLFDKLSQKHEFVNEEGLAETRDNNRLVYEDNVHVDNPDGTVKEPDIKNTIFDDDHESITVPESCVDDISSLNKDQEAITSRNISFDNGIECRSPSPITISDASSYADCNDVQFDSPNDSGIVSSQAYTPDEHILVKTFPSEIFIKNVTDPFAVDQKSEEFSEPKHDSIVNVQSVPKVQTKEPVININKSFEDEHASHGSGSTFNSASDISFKISTPDKVVKLNSDIYIAKVSVKTVNIEEVKISPHGLYSDIISVAKVESPTFAKEVICLPQSSPPPTENTFQVFHGVEESKDFVTNKELLNHSGGYLTDNNCDKHSKNGFLDTDEMLLYMDSDVTVNLDSDLPNDESDSIPQYTCIEESPKITGKSPSKLIENIRNNNVNVCTSDIINVSQQTHISHRELINEALMSSDSLNDLKLGESLSELNPDSKMNHKQKLSDLLLHSALLQNAADTNKITSLPSATAKNILPGKDFSESSNELFEQKANEIIFSVLHSAIDELQNIHQRHMNIMPGNNHTLTDIKHVKENVSEDHPDVLGSGDHPEVLVKCPGKPSDLILNEDTDLIMSVAVGIVNDVISSSKQLVVSNIYPDVLSKDCTTDDATKQKPPTINGLSLNNQHGLVEDATNSNNVVSSFGYDNVVHLPSCEVNSNVLEVTTEVSPKVESRQATKPNSDELGSKVTEYMNKKDADKTIETNVLTKTEFEEHLSFSKSSVKADTYSLINEPYINGDLMLDDIHCDRQIRSLSLGTEGSMEDFNFNNICKESSNRSDFSDFLQFSVHNSKYVEISGSDDESTDEEKDCDSEQASGNDSYVPVQSRRVRIYPLALSPIYEDDSACEDSLSNNSSPKYNEGAMASNSGHDHTSILSLLQSVSDRLKEADLEETSREERFLALSNEVSVLNDRCNKEEPGELEDMISTSKTLPNVPSTHEDKKTSLDTRSGLFITKSFAENKPNPFSGRQSLLLNLTSHSNIYGSKSSLESSSVTSLKSESSVSPTAQSTDLSPSTAAVNLLSSEPVLPIQSSPVDHKPRMSPKSVYYQYFHASQNYLSNIEDNGSPAQEKLEEPKKTAEPYIDLDNFEYLKFNPRPGKVILSDIVDQENKIELKADVLDATSWEYPNGVNIRVIRGCWILYEKPHFEGQAHVLEEGEAVLWHLWGQRGANTKPDKIILGSVKRVVKDYLPEVVISSLQDVGDSPIYIRAEVPSLENLVGNHPRSLVVNSGVWLAYTEPQYNGTVTVLEEDSALPQIQDSGFRSIRPLKMGGLKVQLPSDPKIIIYEKPHFQGWSREITEHVCSIGTLTHDGENSSAQDVGSIQVLGGIWVGYENERFKGQQYLLEEGDYEDWHAWGGYNNTLQSMRYLQADFLESSVTLYETDEEDGKQINLFNQAVPDLELAGYNTRTKCIHVTKGMWVAYQEKHFCGKQYVLEKGRYKSYMHWGGSNNTIMSIRPVLLEPLGRNDMKHLIKAYSGAKFQGESMDFTQGVSSFTSFMPMSFKVLRGCWLLCYEADSSDNLCVLEEGHFPDLALCGCPTAEIKYIKPIDYVFAEPSISLFALDSCEGRELHFEDAVTSVLSKDLHFYAQSMWVRRGLWIAFEAANFLGRQMLLDPQQILNWSQFSGWKAIGSLRPVKQPSVYFMVKSRDRDKYLTVTGKLADSRATFVSVAPRNGQTTQIWYFSRGFLKSKVNGSCLDVIGGKNIQGSKVSLWAEHGKTRQKWKINKDGTISSYLSDNLVLDLKGGNYYDQNYLVVNQVQENALTQKWDIEIL